MKRVLLSHSVDSTELITFILKYLLKPHPLSRQTKLVKIKNCFTIIISILNVYHVLDMHVIFVESLLEKRRVKKLAYLQHPIILEET